MKILTIIFMSIVLLFPANMAAAAGVPANSYYGHYYSAKWEPVRQCIVWRESRGNYRAENPTSSASGAYQFLLSTSNYVARKMHRNDLIGKRAGSWSKKDQDQAFWTLFNRGRGYGHWGGHC